MELLEGVGRRKRQEERQDVGKVREELECLVLRNRIERGELGEGRGEEGEKGGNF